MLKKLIILLLCFTWAPWCRAGETLTLGYFQAEPHIFYDRDSQKVSGALITLLETYLGPEIGVEFRWAPQPFNVARQLDLMERDKLDGAALLVWTKERARKFTYTRHPFALAKPVVGVMAESPLVRVTGPGDLAGLRIGSAGGTYITPFMLHPGIHLVPVFSGEPNTQNLRKLNLGRIDAMYIPDKAALLSEMKALSMEGLVRVMDLPEPAVSLHVVFGNAHRQVAGRFDTAWESLNGQQIYRTLLGRYLDVDAL